MVVEKDNSQRLEESDGSRLRKSEVWGGGAGGLRTTQTITTGRIRGSYSEHHKRERLDKKFEKVNRSTGLSLGTSHA